MGMQNSKDINLFSISKKGKQKKRRTMRLVANAVLGPILAISTLVTGIMGAYIFGVSNVGINPNADGSEEPGVFC